MPGIYEAIGFNVIVFAITLLVVFICSDGLSIGERIKMIVGEVILMALLTVGVMLLTLGK